MSENDKETKTDEVGNLFTEIEEDRRWIIDASELELERFDTDGYIAMPLPDGSRLLTVRVVEGKLLVFYRWDLAARNDAAEVHGFILVESGRIMDGNKWTVLLYMGSVDFNGKLYHVYKARKEF